MNGRSLGPGHGSVFNVSGTDDHYFAYLEFGRRSTNRQTYVNSLEFNEDGTIRPVDLTLKGVGALHTVPHEKRIRVVSSKASSVRADLIVKRNQDSLFKRTESFSSQFAFDDANGSRWMTDADDSTSWIVADLGSCNISNAAKYILFVLLQDMHIYWSILLMVKHGSLGKNINRLLFNCPTGTI